MLGSVGGCWLACFGLFSFALLFLLRLCFVGSLGWRLCGCLVWSVSRVASVWLGAALGDFCGFWASACGFLFGTGNSQQFQCSDVSLVDVVPVEGLRFQVLVFVFMFMFGDVSFCFGFSVFVLVPHVSHGNVCEFCSMEYLAEI